MNAAEVVVPATEFLECRPRLGLPNVLAKLRAGKSVRVAYFGGSITQAEGWRVQTHEWLAAQFPGAKLEMIHAALGGTGSDLGVFRVDQDVLPRRPDLVFVEFAVNDGNMSTPEILCTMEGIVRKLWRQDADCDICFVYTLSSGMMKRLAAGEVSHTVNAHERVAEHYGIPSIHLGLDVVRLWSAGELLFPGWHESKDKPLPTDKIIFSFDGAHPTPEGHRYYTQAIQRSMPALQAASKAAGRTLAAALCDDNWQTARLTPLREEMFFGDHHRLVNRKTWPPIAWLAEMLPDLWHVEGGGGVCVRFNGTGVGVYDAIGPDAGQLRITVDGKAVEPVLRFDGHCQYYRCYYIVPVQNLPAGEHEVRFELDPAPLDKAACFEAEGAKMDDPAKYTGNVWYPAAVLVIGEAL